MPVKTRVTSRDAFNFFLFLAFAAASAHAEPVELPVGISIPLVLQHHVNSGYTPAGSPVYFRVGRDVVVSNQVLVAKGTIVQGQMQQASERGMVGKAGSMLLGVRMVPAVDGTNVPVDADLSQQGRSRAGATVGWTIFWGLPGLITKGVNSYLMKGGEMSAVVSSATKVDPAAALPAAAPTELGPEIAISEHRWHGEGKNEDVKIDIERKKKLESVAFRLDLPPLEPNRDAVIESLRLLSADGVDIPETVTAFSASDGTALFDAWSVARYCNDGSTALLFVGKRADGTPFHATRAVHLTFKKKG